MTHQIENDQIIQMVSEATEAVFATMLNVKTVRGDCRVEACPPSPAEGVLALVGLAGAWVGTGTFSCSADAARGLTGAFLMQEYAAVDEEVLDALGEIANMIFGNVKTMLEEKLGPMGLSIPTVVFGRNFTTRSVGNRSWVVVPVTAREHNIEVRLCLCPNARPRGTERLTAALSMLT